MHTDQLNQLEDLVNGVGLAMVLDELSRLAFERSQHLQEKTPVKAYQSSAYKWEQISRTLDGAYQHAALLHL